MQDYDWNDLRYVLAVHRAGSLAGAARLLAVNETTVARRIRALESRLRTTLFSNSGLGRYAATDIGLAVLEKASRIEQESIAIDEAVGRFRHRVAGTVRLTSVPAIIHQIIVPRLATFHLAYPDIALELVPSTSNLSLSRREADIALRLARPETGGSGAKTRKLGSLEFSAYVSASPPSDIDRLDWIGYDEENSHLPQARWITQAVAAKHARCAPLRVGDIETAREAVAAGLGRTLLPRMIADTDGRLLRLPDDGLLPAMPSRELWMLWHALMEGSRRSVSAVKAWLSEITWK